ncbi:MAG: hypothetical protein ACPMAQ_16740 [Phycisphaerae bacterium]
MHPKRKFVVASAGVVAVAVIAYFGWPRGPCEFRGTLLYDPDALRIPEDPPVLAFLITATGTCELDAPDRDDRQKWRPLLSSLNGRQVTVKGTRVVRHSTYSPSREHITIIVEELVPATPGTTTAPPSPARGAGG